MIFEQWRAEQRERIRAAGMDIDRLAYAPHCARLEFGEDERSASSPPVSWDEHAGERFKRAIILGDPGSGKTWLLRYEARRLARHAHSNYEIGQFVA